jgi:cytochrome P450
MANANETSQLPPGSDGLPLLGETLSFIQNIFLFIRERSRRYGPVFRTNILGKPTVFISGPQLADKWLDTRLIERAGALPPNVLQLFGGDANIVPLLDGEAHRRRKQFLLSAFSREAIASYLPGLQRTIEEHLAGWVAAGEMAITEDLKQLAIEAICGAILGLGPGDELRRLLDDYGRVGAAFVGLPIDLPGTAYRAGLKARDRILAVLREQVRKHEQQPGTDGLSRILATASAAGEPLAIETAAREMHHFMLAGVIVFAELAAIVRELHDHEAVRERVAAEVEAHSPAGPVSPGQLRQMPYLMQFVNEVKRTCPNVPMSFGRARASIPVNGYVIPPGWLVMMAVAESNMNGVFTDPSLFDPERFGPARAEQERHPHAFMPQGAGEISGHKCAGYDFSTVMMQLFTIALVRGYRWELPRQDLGMRWNKIPPEYKSGLVVRARNNR